MEGNSKKLKIAFVVPSFPTTTETFVLNQIIYLLDQGHKVKIFAFTKNHDVVIHQALNDYELLDNTVYFSDSYKQGIWRYFPFVDFFIRNIRDIDLPRIFNQLNLFKYGFRSLNLRFYYKFKWMLDHEQWDIIHAHFAETGMYIAEMKESGFFSRSKFINTFHGYDISPHLVEAYKIRYRELFKWADLLTVNTPYSLSILEEIKPDISKVIILPVGLNSEKFSPKKLKKKHTNFHILFLGRLIEFKAPDLALEILNNLLNKGYKNIYLTIAGRGKMKKELLRRISTYGISKFVRLEGEVSQERIVDLMDDADILLAPGVYDENKRAETQGLVIQEAQAMELPVVVSDVGGMKYGVQDGITGFVVKAGEIERFADKIELLISDEKLRKKIGSNGRAMVAEEYDYQVLGRKLEGYYLSLLNITQN